MNTPSNFQELISGIVNIINPLLVLLVGLSLFVFFKGLAVFISKAGDAKNHADGKNLMIWGLIGLFVMVSFLGIIQFFYNDVGFSRPFGIPFLPESRTR